MTVDKVILYESAQKIHFPSFCYGKSGFVAMMTANYTATELDFFSIMLYKELSQKEWTDLDKDKDQLHNIIVERFGKNWPKHIEQVCRDYPRDRLALYP